jgi:carnitine 3-dehydrogenase
MDVLSKTNKGKGWGAGALHKDYVKRLSTLAKKPVSAAAARAKANKPVKKAAKSAKKAAKKG